MNFHLIEGKTLNLYINWKIIRNMCDSEVRTSLFSARVYYFQLSQYSLTNPDNHQKVSITMKSTLIMTKKTAQGEFAKKRWQINAHIEFREDCVSK